MISYHFGIVLSTPKRVDHTADFLNVELRFSDLTTLIESLDKLVANLIPANTFPAALLNCLQSKQTEPFLI